MPVLVERRGPVTTVVLARPQAANAVDRRTAQQLADAFRAAVSGCRGVGLELHR